MKYRNYVTYPYKNRGFVLITSVIFLVVLTLLVIYAARSSIVSERGAGNMRNRSQAFQMAELAQKWAKERLTNSDIITWGGSGYILQGTAPNFTAAGGNSCLIDKDSDCNLLPGDDKFTKYPSAVTKDTLHLYEMPRFIIRQTGVPQDAEGCEYFEVTTQGYGAKQESKVIIRSLVKACP